MYDDLKLLKSIDIFSELNDKELNKITSLISQEQLVEGEVFMERGKPADKFYIVLSGSYLIHFKEDRSFTLHNQGDVIGWSTVVKPHLYTGNGTALTNGEILTIDGAKLYTLICNELVLGDKLMKKINNIVADRLKYVKGTGVDDIQSS